MNSKHILKTFHPSKHKALSSNLSTAKINKTFNENLVSKFRCTVSVKDMEVSSQWLLPVILAT
jgi:hypothetical protein